MTIAAHLTEQARRVDLIALAQTHNVKLLKRGSDWCGPCPHCGGTNRFVLTPRKAVFFCRGCNARGDAIALLQLLTGCGFHKAVEQLTGAPLPKRREPAKPAPDPDFERQVSEELFQWWDDAKPIRGTPAGAYLKTRHIDVEQIPEIDDVLRYHPRCIFGHRRWRGCLIALIRDVITNKRIGIVRTSLDAHGRKAPVIDGGEPVARKVLGRKQGGAVKLWPDESVERGLVIGEGVETVLSAAQYNHQGTLLQPAWAMVDSTNLRYFPVLPAIEYLTIIVDNDPPDQRGRRAGQHAAAICTAAWTAAGRDVLHLLSDQEGQDFNDVVRTMDEVA